MYVFLEGGEGRERNIYVREIHQSVASSMPPTGDLDRNPGVCPKWDLNWQPFGSQDGTQSTKPGQPEPYIF